MKDKNLSLGWVFNEVINPLSWPKASSTQVLFAANHSCWQLISRITPPGSLGSSSLNPNIIPSPNPKWTKLIALFQTHPSYIISTMPLLCKAGIQNSWRSWESKLQHVRLSSLFQLPQDSYLSYTWALSSSWYLFCPLRQILCVSFSSLVWSNSPSFNFQACQTRRSLMHIQVLRELGFKTTGQA